MLLGLHGRELPESQGREKIKSEQFMVPRWCPSPHARSLSASVHLSLQLWPVYVRLPRWGLQVLHSCWILSAVSASLFFTGYHSAPSLPILSISLSFIHFSLSVNVGQSPWLATQSKFSELIHCGSSGIAMHGGVISSSAMISSLVFKLRYSSMFTGPEQVLHH